MTPEQRKQAIMRHMGWPKTRATSADQSTAPEFVHTESSCLPWPSLDALALVEATLSNERKYANLRHLVPEWQAWTDGTAYLRIAYATFDQRLEALCKTLGLEVEG